MFEKKVIPLWHYFKPLNIFIMVEKFLSTINKRFWAAEPVTNLAAAAEQVGVTHNVAIGATRSGVVIPIIEELQPTFGKGYMLASPDSDYGDPGDADLVREETRNYYRDWLTQK